MEQFIEDTLLGYSDAVLLVVIAVMLGLLAKFADLVVDYAVVLSQRSGVPKVIIGATVVSLGTTAPEVAVSVLAAFKGDSGLALGNAVGSIICDTGLILGIACLIHPLAIPFETANRQGWVQLGAAVLLVLFCVPWSNPAAPYTDGTAGVFPRWGGFVFLGLLAVYLWLSVKWSKAAVDSVPVAVIVDEYEHREFELSAGSDKSADRVVAQRPEHGADGNESAILTLLKLLLAIIGVVLSANVLIPAIRIMAVRWGVPQSVIAATMVAFGTSLPELITAVQAARRGHGDLAVGNIIGADILNALFVAGASAAVTTSGLVADAIFFRLQFPAMLIVLVVFRIGIATSKGTLGRGFGCVLLGTYLVYLVLNVIHGAGGGH